MGHLVHKICEILSKLSMLKHDKKSKYWDFEYLWKIVYNHYQQERPEICQEIKADKLKGICRGLVALLDSEYSPICDRTIAVEQYFKIPLEKPLFLLDDLKSFFSVRGIIDRVDKISDTCIEIIDYKTGTNLDMEAPGRPPLDSISLKKKIQPRIYHLAAKTLFPFAKEILITFHYIATAGPITCVFSDSDLEETMRKIEDRYRAIKANENPSRVMGTKDGWKCKHLCSHGNSGTCNEVWAEKNKLGLEFVTNKYITLNYGAKKK